MMKQLSIVVPCYNSEAYMRKCIDSLLPGGEAVEILIIDDGSTDRTGEIADAYAARFPTIVRAVHQENKGHGGAINTGIGMATGRYCKVVDSDDWVNLQAYEKVLSTLRAWRGRGPDMLVTNYVYEKEGKRHKQRMHYATILPEGKEIVWTNTRRFPKGRYMLMHSLIYRTALLHDIALRLPQHTFYVDNLFAYIPLISVRSLYYLNVDFYRYYIGRPDQSVQENVMIARIDQQLRVNRLMVDAMDFSQLENPRQHAYLLHYLEIITMVSIALLLRSGTDECMQKKESLWRYIRAKDVAMYRKLRFGLFGMVMNLPGVVGRRIAVTAYQAAQKMVGFN